MKSPERITLSPEPPSKMALNPEASGPKANALRLQQFGSHPPEADREAAEAAIGQRRTRAPLERSARHRKLRIPAKKDPTLQSEPMLRGPGFCAERRQT